MKFRRIICSFMFFCLMAGASLNLSASEASFQFGFKVGKHLIDSTYKYNARALTRAREELSSSQGVSITITAYSSPDGKFSRNRQLATLRGTSVSDYLASLIPDGDSCSIKTVVVSEDWDGVKRYLERSSLEWKQDALAIVSSKDGDKEELLKDLWVGEAWEDLIKNCFPSLRRVTVSIDKNAVPDAQELDSDSCSIIFRCGSSALPVSKALVRMAKSSVPSLYVGVKSSPEGKESDNQALGLRRAQRVKEKLIALGYKGEIVTVYLGEDWDGLATNVSKATDLVDKDAVLDILSDATLDRNSRKKALQALSYGNTWLRLMSEEMSDLRKATVSPAKQ